MTKAALQLESLCVDVRGVGGLSVQQIKQDSTYTLLMASLCLKSFVYPATSLIGSKNRELISVGSNVQFTTGPNEVT